MTSFALPFALRRRGPVLRGPVLRSLVLCGLFLCLFAVPGGPARAQAVPEPDVADPPAGVYALDPAHASLLFRVDHLGFSMYTARFTRFEAELTFDPDDPEACAVAASVEVASLETDYPFDDLDFDAQLTGPEWLDAAQYPRMTFRSTRIETTGPRSARVHGDLTLHGVTRPLVLEATFNGGYGGHPYDPGGARIGFSARGTLSRSAFGVDLGLPAPGSTIGVGDRVEFAIEAEFLRPRDAPAAQ